jgi:hypothetical protein
MTDFLTYVETNALKALAWGIGGFGFVMLVKLF